MKNYKNIQSLIGGYFAFCLTVFEVSDVFLERFNIEGDYFNYNEKTHSLVGERTNKIHQLGDPVNVVVKKADLVKRQLDFILGE